MDQLSSIHDLICANFSHPSKKISINVDLLAQIFGIINFYVYFCKRN